ncbi:tetratricopeptide repeat protein, partial [Streptomyces sp. NPDC058418]|uniref:tetratricopeptide repeat protein n=1 Tax=Streptomyces sp. NPDC058418 TaxID=3346488 RepID=UPI00365AEC00
MRQVRLNIPAIIRVINYAQHTLSAAEFIVMEFADGASLEWVAAQIAGNEPPFDGFRVHEFVVSYGLRILDALSYLHEREEFVYGDISLTNVLHCGNGIKLIDLAGVRQIGSPGPVTHRPPEIGEAGEMSVAGDLYGVGVVLRQLLRTAPPRPSDLGSESLELALSRATAHAPRDRYASAREMAVQLRGVLRELRSLRLDEETFEPSPLFGPSAALEEFSSVYAAIPGEYAPKLALGYCHERLGNENRAVEFYRAVWRRNHALGSAAFGLARIHLAQGRPDLALASLAGVPADSRHRTAARTAMVRIHADVPADGSVPSVAAAARAYTTLHRLTRSEGLTDRHARERLATDL